MAVIGGSPFQQNPVGFNTGLSTPGVGPAGSLGFTAPTGPGGLNYGGQVMSEVDLLVALMKLLQQGQSCPSGQCAAPASTSPGLQSAAGKGGGALAKAGGKGGGGARPQAPALAAAAGKGAPAPALKQATGKA